MNFLKKKLKPLTAGLTYNANQASNRNERDKDLEDDLYDEYVVEAPPHPSELLALGVDPSEIDVNDPEKLRELYRKAKEEGKDKKTNSVLLAKQRQKEEIEEKKKTREEWKAFDSITARLEQALNKSQKTLEQLKESSAIDKLTEPDYELRLTADEVFKSSATVKAEKSADNWINFGEEEQKESEEKEGALDQEEGANDLDEFGCPKEKRSSTTGVAEKFVVEELLQDFGIDLRTEEQRRQEELAAKKVEESPVVVEQVKEKVDIDLKVSARPRPRPNSKSPEAREEEKREEDPFDTSFVSSAAPPEEPALLGAFVEDKTTSVKKEQPAVSVDPFDTSYVDF